MNPYLPPGAEDDMTAPWWDREETITVCQCKHCGEEIETGDECATCHAVENDMCISCLKEQRKDKDSDLCASCHMDALMRYTD